MKIIGRIKQIPVFFKNNKKTIQAIILAVIGILSVYSWTLPISDDFCKLSILQRTFVVISAQCGIVFLGFMIATTIKNAKKDKKYLIDLFYISPIVVIETIGVCMLFDHNLWGHKSLFAGLSLIYILFVEAFASIRTLFNKTFGKENTPVLLIAFAVVSLFLAVISETAGIIEPANVCYKICIGIAYLIAIALFTDKYLYRPKKAGHTISHIIGIISWGALITISFPFYIQWCGLTGTDFDAFVSVYAAVLGGGITLAGVAWTIKDANDDKKKDLLMQHRPILYAHMMSTIDVLKQTPIELLFVDFRKIKEVAEIEAADKEESEQSKKPLPLIPLKSIVNTDNSIVIIKKIMINDIELTPLNNNVMAKNKAYNLLLHLTELTDKDKIKLFVEDVLKTPYCFSVIPYIHKDKKGNDQYGIMRLEECKTEVPNE